MIERNQLCMHMVWHGTMDRLHDRLKRRRSLLDREVYRCVVRPTSALKLINYFQSTGESIPYFMLSSLTLRKIDGLYPCHTLQKPAP